MHLFWASEYTRPTCLFILSLYKMQQNKQVYSKLIKTEAKKLGFLFCGISQAGFLEEEAPSLGILRVIGPAGNIGSRGQS